MAAADKLRKLAPVASALVLAAAVFAVWKFGLIENVTERERLVQMLRQDGWRGPMICIAVQYLQVIVFAIPGEITQIAAGYVFGALNGFVYSVVGILLGSGTAFVVGRYLGRPLAKKILSEESIGKLENAAQSKRGRLVLFLLFLLPGAPKDAMSYGAGVSGFRFLEFVIISSLGRTPALLFRHVVRGSTVRTRLRIDGGHRSRSRGGRADLLALPEEARCSGCGLVVPHQLSQHLQQRRRDLH